MYLIHCIYNRRSRSRERRPTREEPIRKQITIPRRQRKKSNFDVYPNGVTDENAAAFATQAILQHNMAALQGAVGPASFGGAPPPVRIFNSFFESISNDYIGCNDWYE